MHIDHLANLLKTFQITASNQDLEEALKKMSQNLDGLKDSDVNERFSNQLKKHLPVTAGLSLSPTAKSVSPLEDEIRLNLESRINRSADVLKDIRAVEELIAEYEVKSFLPSFPDVDAILKGTWVEKREQFAGYLKELNQQNKQQNSSLMEEYRARLGLS